jgi:hypothetical protein
VFMYLHIFIPSLTVIFNYNPPYKSSKLLCIGRSMKTIHYLSQLKYRIMAQKWNILNIADYKFLKNENILIIITHS